jgi:hypothetical protein
MTVSQNRKFKKTQISKKPRKEKAHFFASSKMRRKEQDQDSKKCHRSRTCF